MSDEARQEAEATFSWLRAGGGMRFHRRAGTFALAVLERVPASIAVKDLRSRLIYVNRAFEEMWGVAAADVLGRPIPPEFLPPPGSPPLPSDAVALAGGVEEVETEVIAAGQRRCFVRLMRFPIVLGGRVSAIGSILIDLTDRRRLEESLAETKDEYLRLVETMPEGIFIQQDGTLVYVNATGARMLGYAEASVMIGSRAFRHTPEEYLERHRTRVNEALATRTAMPPSEEERMRRDGQRFPVEVMPTFVVWEGRPAVLILTRDITVRRRAEAELRARNAALVEVNDRLNQFAYAASHDLQSPLRTMVSFSELLGRRIEPALKADPEAAHYLDQVVSAARRMQSLIADMLAYIRLDDDVRPMRRVPVGEVVEDALANLRSVVDETGARLEIGPMPAVRGRRAQLVQLFQNLLANALKFHGDGAPHVRVAAERDGRVWLFCVEDDGIGIEAEYAQRIFEPFRRLHSRAAYAGSGLGLAICRWIVESHGGRIWLDDTPHGAGSDRLAGACFRFTLPSIDDQDG